MKFWSIIIESLTIIFPYINWLYCKHIKQSVSGAIQGAKLVFDFKKFIRRERQLRYTTIAYDDSLFLLRARPKLYIKVKGSEKPKLNNYIIKTLSLLDKQIYSVYFSLFIMDSYQCLVSRLPLSGAQYLPLHKLVVFTAIAFEGPVIFYLFLRVLRIRRLKTVIVGIITLVEWLIRKILALSIPILGICFCMGELQRYLRKIGLSLEKSPVEPDREHH